MKKVYRLELEEARVMIAAAIAKSEEIGVLESICIVDDGGYPIALERMNGARITGPQIAWNKAFTAAGHKRSTHLFNTPPNGPALPGNEAFGIQWSFDGKFAVFVGGFPIVIDDEVVGGVGLSGGNGEQDTKAGLAALQALADMLAEQGLKVTVTADIKK
ncbi:CDP-alcohol phosphatidyltransferase [Bordetella genomosp. 5]|uniref:CDP-alcohol phosphatidyltransferase n=1 Tax=Bordetella genomosp. 5 TaxID=1395608 RepID=A0A261U177_9BORD|nr:heme-binding protein [Bordetella genomosp. 5]OZI47359.1 CDP-alcohol phosphatidyltransferase [Bordetella genomosp. 5]OZI55301.1 CDP-alcohol phosphatidyltransferase [Bordetella genomosp. 5]